MRSLFLDVGNTNIIYLFDGKIGSVKTEYCLDFKHLHRFFADFVELERVICASVVPKVDDAIARVLSEVGIEFRNIKITDIPIKIDIESPEELGIDRAINAVAALKKFGKNIIVIDFGTALTFDIVHNGIYCGGMIFPGLAMAMHNLHTKTAKLPDVKVVNYQTGIGKNTVDAIKNSACIGYTGVIKEHIDFISGYYSTDFKIVFTGGSGKMFYHIFDGAIFEQNLILEYISRIY